MKLTPLTCMLYPTHPVLQTVWLLCAKLSKITGATISKLKLGKQAFEWFKSLIGLTKTATKATEENYQMSIFADEKKAESAEKSAIRQQKAMTALFAVFGIYSMVMLKLSDDTVSSGVKVVASLGMVAAAIAGSSQCTSPEHCLMH